MSQVGLIIFIGAQGPSNVERMIEGAHRAIARDTVAKALASGRFAPIIISTPLAAVAADFAGLPVTIEPDSQPFHFGTTLRYLVRKYALAHVLYLGGGSAALLDTKQFDSLADMILTAPAGVVANNIASADFVGFTPGATLERFEPPDKDNSLATLLHKHAGLPRLRLERTPATLFDVDTPTDLQILLLHPGVGAYTAAYLDTLNLDVTRLRRTMPVFINSQAEMMIAGRVGTDMWASLGPYTACRKRLYSEERGMRSSGREDRGEVRSLVGEYLRVAGPHRFFELVGQMCDAAFIDSRVLFAHLGLSLPAADRFHSDLLQAEHIQHEWARDFTVAARDAPVPVILGGHTLVAGGLWALIEAAWLENDQRRQTQGV